MPFFGRMLPILIYFSILCISILWSDYPFVAFKHWNKGIGDIVMVLIILTDPILYAALKRVLNRVRLCAPPTLHPFHQVLPIDWTGFHRGGISHCTPVSQRRKTPSA